MSTSYSTWDIAEHTICYDGGTFMAEHGTVTLIDPDSVTHSDFAWMVAVPADTNRNGMARNRVYRLSTAPGSYVNTVEVQKHVWDFLRFHHDGMATFGTWIDNGHLYIDHVIFTTLADATARAIEAEEKAIYNLKTKETVTL